jgi:tRNA pseudouridine13 synthase
MDELFPAKLKYKVEDFIVEEVGEKFSGQVSSEFSGGKTDSGNLDLDISKDFLWCELEKFDIDHFGAIKEVARLLGIGVRDVSYAGTKDKRAWTSQRISIFRPDIEKVKVFSHPNIVLKNFKWNKRKVKIGYLDGNRFRIVLRDVDKKDAMKVGNKIRGTKWFPNYFGFQRFGVSGNNVAIGEAILKRKFEEATKLISEDSSWQKERFDYYLAKNKDDFAGALKLGDRKSMLMYINSVQSKIFNEVLGLALDEGLDFTKKGQTSCLLMGYKTRFFDGRLGDIEQHVLAEHGLKLEDFNIQAVPYLRMKGSFRKALIEVKDLDLEIEDDEEFSGSKKIMLKFELPSGAYATTFLGNFFELG